MYTFIIKYDEYYLRNNQYYINWDPIIEIILEYLRRLSCHTKDFRTAWEGVYAFEEDLTNIDNDIKVTITT